VLASLGALVHHLRALIVEDDPADADLIGPQRTATRFAVTNLRLLPRGLDLGEICSPTGHHTDTDEPDMVALAGRMVAVSLPFAVYSLRDGQPARTS